MPTRGQIVAKAREYVDTPFHHVGRLKGVGIDCVGLLVCVAAELGVPIKDYTSYSKRPDGVTLHRELEAQLIETDRTPELGRIVSFQSGGKPRHLGIITGTNPLRIIHAHGWFDRVLEHNVDEHWRGKIAKMFDFPGIE